MNLKILPVKNPPIPTNPYFLIKLYYMHGDGDGSTENYMRFQEKDKDSIYPMTLIWDKLNRNHQPHGLDDFVSKLTTEEKAFLYRYFETKCDDDIVCFLSDSVDPDVTTDYANDAQLVDWHVVYIDTEGYEHDVIFTEEP